MDQQQLNENEPLNSALEMEKRDGKPSSLPSIFRPICLSLLLACSSNFQIGYSVTFMNTPILLFRDFFNKSSIDRGYGSMTENHLDWIWNIFLNVWLVGFAIGLWLNSYFNDKLGRRKGFLYMSVLNLFGSCLRFYGIRTEIYELLIFGQFVAALATSVTYQSLILMLQECAPTKLRGLLSCLSEVCVALFAVFGTFISMDFVFGSNLELLVGCAIIPGVIAVFTLIPMYESPKFLLLFKHDKAAAIRSIQFYHGKTADAGDVIEQIKKEGEQELKSSSSFMELFRTAHLRKAVILGIITLQLTCALWVVFFLSTYFLIQVQIDSHFAGWTSTMLVCLYLIGTCFGSAFVDRLGRRKMLLPGAAISLLFLLLYVICAILQPTFHWLKYGCVASLWLHILVYGMGVGPIAWFLCAELVPQKNRSRCQVVCYFINMLISMALTSSLIPLYKAIGPSAFIVLYIVPCVLAWIILYCKLPETKGREIYEIVAELKGVPTVETILINE